MDREAELGAVRRAYAKQVLAIAGVDDPAVEDAFATVRREAFLGPGPWLIERWGQTLGYIPTPDADPVHLYQDNLVGIVPERRLNNGQPSYHADLIHQAAPRAGEHIVHIGAGVGYYTAILAHLVGSSGRVTGIEFDHELAARAKANFHGCDNIEIVEGDGALVAFDIADVIYVNAGATLPVASWLDRVADGGRLILPLTIDKSFLPEFDKITPGCVFQIERRGRDYCAKRISSVAIFPCAGSRDAVSERALALALEKGGAERVTRLYRHDEVAEERCWLRGSDWALGYD